MKSSISISNWIANVIDIIFPVGNVNVRGAVVYPVAGSCAANLRLRNDLVAPVSSMASTANPWVYTARYKRPRCICMPLSNGLSTFPAYLISAGCISFPALSCCLCPYYQTSLFYYWVLDSSWVFFYCAGDFVIFPDSSWQYVPFFCNYSTSVIVVGSCFVHYSFILMLEISRRAWMVIASEIHTVHFLPTSAWLSWLCLGIHQLLLILVPLQILSSWLQAIYKGVYGIAGC